MPELSKLTVELSKSDRAKLRLVAALQRRKQQAVAGDLLRAGVAHELADARIQDEK
jgi:hypothetical protein